MKTEIKPLSREEIIQQSKEFNLFSWSVQGKVNPIPVARAEGIYFWDVNGKRFMDFSSQVMNVNIGHQNPKVLKAIHEQAENLCYAHPGMATEPRATLGRLLAGITPGNLTKSFFCLGGADANENAVKIARAFTGRHKILARYRSYHGATYGAAALTGDQRRLPVEPAMPGVVHILDPYCYRCPFGWTKETCKRQCITHVEEVIQHEGPEYIAAILLEGITGANGLIVPPDEYWPRMREICDRYGILLIADEVMSGFGRTGKWFAVDHWKVTPDIITMAKGITSGYIPLGAVIVSKKIAGYFDDRMLWAGLTGHAHPLACAAAIANIQVYEEDGLIQNSETLGQYLGNRLEELKARYQIIGDVRYKGLFSVVELVEDRETKAELDSKKMATLNAFLLDKGFFTYIKHNLVFIAPPLCITREQMEEGLAILEGGFRLIK